ncbi:glycoside hydrolase family 16 protein [Microbulbifer sp. CAU 1566]|uniref:glycoside hydrolase family 16 protein n=1 Tax=Microbulbifer sp. CAU 1566 TaxID=2933269 RepID=UPI002006C490|nr:glycoside hydrolase family 16 protein [Microbulbifer sp. CAU 1566]MCK7595880.1 glycoside hydrolase family 16 protein [Microbulbifer sp. CAU 1566]
MNYFSPTHGIFAAAFGAVLLSACSQKPAPEQKEKPQDPAAEVTSPAADSKIFFDDFSYQSLSEMAENQWKARTETGHPGVAGARWSGDGISFLQDSEAPGNTLLRMTSSTDGSGENTQHTQFCHQRKYLSGTYAARVFFRDEPISGPDGDQIIETFYTISPLKADMDPDYSEMDFEYLANGGWGEPDNALFATSWETFKLDPFVQDNESSTRPGSFAGWHTLVLQAGEGKLRYFVDGEQFAEHSERVFPEEPMSINFNLWFTAEGLVDSTENRVYQQDIDWVYHSASQILSTEEVTSAVDALRADQVAFADTVPDWEPKLESPCGL